MSDSDAPTTRRLRAFEELVLQHSNDVGLLLHPKYGVVYASPAVEHVLGFTVEHFLGMLASSWVHPDDVPLAIEQRQLDARHGHSGPVQLRGMHSDGTHHWFEAEWWQPDTNDIGTILHFRDVSEREEARAAADRSEARLNALLLEAADVVVLNLRGLTAMTDAFVIASGTSDTHVRGVADHVLEEMARRGLRPAGVDGLAQGRWVVLDFIDVMLHIMDVEQREFYGLEQLWKDAKPVDWQATV